mmetsp:Transcript_6562/g.13710  ORF Transcript_6562/g.13710 Transcript_6562/m.13710 type:complete len:141 (-) Transcript_6562:136-558(-)
MSQVATTSPVVVPIHIKNDNDNQNNSPEWAMIEINGEILQPTESTTPKDKENHPQSDATKDQVELGSLWFDANEVPHMIVGTHELKGKVETLKQPFCVLEKESSTLSTTSYAVQGIISRKILFSQYPKTILSRSSVSSSL